MDKIEKFLRKLTKKEQEIFLLIFEQLRRDYRKLPHIIPLTGKKDWYRIRAGRYRIIFYVTVDQKVEIFRITKRDEKTYKNLN